MFYIYIENYIYCKEQIGVFEIDGLFSYKKQLVGEKDIKVWADLSALFIIFKDKNHRFLFYKLWEFKFLG